MTSKVPVNSQFLVGGKRYITEQEDNIEKSILAARIRQP